MMGYSCVCVDVDFEGHEINKKTVKARKEHICTECGCVIKKNDTYECVDYVYDGEIQVYKTCIPCKNMRDDLFKCGYYYTKIWEDLEVHFFEVLPEDEDDDWKWLKE